MTRMLPPRISDSEGSKAERRAFEMLERGLPDDWTALYSVCLCSHPGKPWAEIDFVLVGPPGIFCLEVKGGRVAREDGLWVFTDRNDRVNRKREGPFEQVGTASAALRRYLVAQWPHLHRVIVGHGVLVPDITFSIRGPEIEPEIVYDVRDKDLPLSTYIRRLIDHWERRIEGVQNSTTAALSEHDRRAIVDLLRGDFDMRPSLRSQAKDTNEQLLRLTSDQYRILDGLTENPRVIVRGGAGTGKTLLAIEEARTRAAEGEHILLTCYNKNLARFLAGILGSQDRVRVEHLHGLMSDLVRDAELTHKLPNVQEQDLFAVHYPELAIDALLKLDLLQTYDTLIVDEAQDLLLESYVDLFDALLKGGVAKGRWRCFLDPWQDVYGGTSPKGMDRLQEANPAQFRLTINCRNTLPIGTEVTLLSAVEADSTLIAGGPDVRHYWYRDDSDQRRAISREINRILSDGIAPRDIVLLSRYRVANSCLRPGLSNVPFRLVELTGNFAARPKDEIVFSTIEGFKGLEADVVFLVDVASLTGEPASSAAYVGASRPRVLLEVFLSEALKADYEELANKYGRRLASRAGSEPRSTW